MKLILSLLFLFVTVFANCQTNEQNVQPPPGFDSLVIPSLNREWSANEFLKVFKIIIAKQNGNSAEIITIKDNKPLFTKVTNINSYWFLESKDHTLDERISFFDSLQDPIANVFFSYYQKSKIISGRLSYEREIADFLDLLFEFTKKQAKIVDEFIKANSSSNPTKMQTDALKQMAQATTTMLNGALITIEKEYAYFSEGSMCKISRTFKSFYSFMSDKIDQDAKTEFDRRIANIMKTHPIECVKAALQTNR